jgi:hypothetical protein
LPLSWPRWRTLDEMGGYPINETFRRTHFKIMTAKGRGLLNSCNMFIAIEPKITSDLGSIKDTIESGFRDTWIRELKSYEAGNRYQNLVRER